MKNGPLPTSGVLSVLSAVAKALDYVHSRAIVHRDIKPANILVSSVNTVTVVDFGIAKLLGHESITSKGDAPGTAFYMPPELLTGGQETGCCDQFSLAVVAYEALSGSMPFQGENPYAVVKHRG